MAENTKVFKNLYFNIQCNSAGKKVISGTFKGFLRSGNSSPQSYNSDYSFMIYMKIH